MWTVAPTAVTVIILETFLNSVMEMYFMLAEMHYYYYYYCYYYNRFTALWPGLPGWTGTRTCHLFLGFYSAREDNRGRHTDNPAGCHPIRPNQRPTSIFPSIFTPDALPATTHPIYPGLGQAPNMLACIPSGFVSQWFGSLRCINCQNTWAATLTAVTEVEDCLKSAAVTQAKQVAVVGSKQRHGYYRPVIGSDVCHIKWHHCWWPEVIFTVVSVIAICSKFSNSEIVAWRLSIVTFGVPPLVYRPRSDFTMCTYSRYSSMVQTRGVW